MDVLDGKQIVTTSGKSVVSNPTVLDVTHLESLQEEADTRLFLHVADSVSRGFEKVMVRTVDSDVVVLAIYVFQNLSQLKKLWIAFGRQKSFRMIPVHTLSQQLGKDKCLALPMFHSLTGCDTVSAFFGHGKQSAWDLLGILPECITALKSLTVDPPDEADIPKSILQALGLLVTKLYGLEGNDVDAARLDGHYYQVSYDIWLTTYLH